MEFIQMDDIYPCHLMDWVSSENTFTTQRFERRGLHISLNGASVKSGGVPSKVNSRDLIC